jgi:hypothetical protein
MSLYVLAAPLIESATSAYNGSVNPAAWRCEMAGVGAYARFTPEVLSHAGRAILDWPRGIHSIADRIRRKANERAGFYGVAKELG